MGDYAVPANAPISSSWQDHRNRNPPSSEPGTDYACGYGTPVACAGNGRVADLKTSNGGGTGRYLTVDLDDGRRVRYLHLSGIWRSVGDRVARGEQIASSGASGYGNDWYYGPHVHVTLFPRQNYDFSSTIDFQLYVGDGDDMDKQDIKDAMFEFYRDVNGPPAGYTDWPFFQNAVWNAPVTAQDVNGMPVLDEQGNPVRYAANGYLASINAVVQEPQTPRTRTVRADPLARALLAVVAVLGVIGAAELGILIYVLATAAPQ